MHENIGTISLIEGSHLSSGRVIESSFARCLMTGESRVMEHACAARGPLVSRSIIWAHEGLRPRRPSGEHCHRNRGIDNGLWGNFFARCRFRDGAYVGSGSTAEASSGRSAKRRTSLPMSLHRVSTEQAAALRASALNLAKVCSMGLECACTAGHTTPSASASRLDRAEHWL